MAVFFSFLFLFVVVRRKKKNHTKHMGISKTRMSLGWLTQKCVLLSREAEFFPNLFVTWQFQTAVEDLLHCFWLDCILYKYIFFSPSVYISEIIICKLIADPFGTLDPFGSSSFGSNSGFADFSQMSKVGSKVDYFFLIGRKVLIPFIQQHLWQLCKLPIPGLY